MTTPVYSRDPFTDQHPILRPIELHLLARPGLVGLERLSGLSLPPRLQLFLDPAVQRGPAARESHGAQTGKNSTDA
jgi:hypothetical protein